MEVVLEGDSPAALTAGILLLSRARSFGLVQLKVNIVGDPADITPVPGPAVLHSTVLASCGVGRELGQGPLVVVPGPATEPLLVCLAADGLGGWFEVDTCGGGVHPATQAFVRLCRDRRPRARQLGRSLRDFMGSLGLPSEPALLDFLFGAPAPELSRVALTLRAGRAITGDTGLPVHQWLAGDRYEVPDALPRGVGGQAVLDGDLEPLLSRLTLRARDRVEDALSTLRVLAEDDGGRDLALVGSLGEVLSSVVVLPPHSMLPPPDAASDAVATGLGRALGATRGEHDASQALVEVFRFLGGRFVEDEPHPLRLGTGPAPETRAEIWRWFVEGVQRASDRTEEIWREVMDRPS